MKPLSNDDIDFAYEQSHKNVLRLCAALREFGTPEMLIDPDFLLSPNAVTQIGNPPLRIDLLSSISGVSIKEVRVGAVEAGTGGAPLLIIGLGELRRNKQASGHPKDREDLTRLGMAAKVSRKRGHR